MSIRVLVVDDSALVRRVLTSVLQSIPGIEVVGTAPDPYVARDKILELDPDVLTLDIEMPRMDGLTFLRKLQRFHPLPVIIISSLGSSTCAAGMEALRVGAVEVMEKPPTTMEMGGWRDRLSLKIRAAAAARRSPASAVPAASPISQPTPAGACPVPYHLVAIGASTGGTEAIRQVLERLPANIPPVVIVQHIPPVFSRQFAMRLNASCPFEVKEADHNDEVRPGRVLVAPGNQHMTVYSTGRGYRVRLEDGPPVRYQKPSVDVLFRSVAKAAGRSGIGMLLTGMGEDGADGLLVMRQAGAYTIAQDEASCVVFGMPGEAIRRGAVVRVLPLSSMATALMTGRGQA
jgi:two-component system chemotaxis response regulator CheB